MSHFTPGSQGLHLQLWDAATIFIMHSVSYASDFFPHLLQDFSHTLGQHEIISKGLLTFTMIKYKIKERQLHIHA